MKKLIALLMALVMTMSLATVAWGAPVTDESGLNTAITAGGEVVLGGNVEITTTIVISNTVTVDLAGYKLTGPDDGQSNWYAFVVADGGKLTLKDSSAAQTGVLWAKCFGVETKGGTFVMESGKIDATTNGGIGAAIVNYGGTVIVNDGELVASHAAVNTQSYFAAATTDINGGTMETKSTTSAAVQVGGEYSQNTETVTVDGGEIVGDVAVSVDKDTADVTIAGGDVKGAVAASAGDLAVSGGTFSSDVTTYLAPGLELTDGGVVVPEGGAAVAAKSYKKTSDGALAVGDVNAIYSPAVAAVLNDDGKQTNTANIAHYDLGGADYVVAASLSDADVVLYSDAAGKNVMMYLKKAVVSYAGTGAAYANFGKACGQVTYTAEAGKTYYITNANGDAGIYVADAKGTKALMYGGQLITVNATPVAYTTAAVKHAAVPTVKDGKVVGYTCATCKLAAVEAPNFMSIPKGAAVVTGNWYWPVATAGTTTGGTVTSAETFDAGIAMYVGMSVMAAAGSAVVIGKKKD